MSNEELPTTKVGRLIDAYELDGFGAELEAYWTAEGEERKSLRALAELFNKELLRRQLRDHGMDTVDDGVQMYYRLLTDDDASAGRVTDAKRDLEDAGIDVDSLTSDFVTYQAIRSYLQDVRGASYDHATDEEQVAREREQIERLTTRTEVVSREKLERLSKTDRITLGDFRLFVSVDVFCEDCNAQYSVAELLERGGCDCEAES
ncbi:rod-determining factor RdfA [Haloarcula marina]|uniref:rod-determining factor RdfA n=1 Tax=Haloarcula marina TaxID=2961574 RepID=UPI0020B70788|nr:rod-determining factor RdfA [Halomicroarcula marina]